MRKIRFRSSFNKSNEIYKLVLLAKDWFMLDKKFNQNLSTNFLSKKLIHVKWKVC